MTVTDACAPTTSRHLTGVDCDAQHNEIADPTTCYSQRDNAAAEDADIPAPIGCLKTRTPVEVIGEEHIPTTTRQVLTLCEHRVPTTIQTEMMTENDMAVVYNNKAPTTSRVLQTRVSTDVAGNTAFPANLRQALTHIGTTEARDAVPAALHQFPTHFVTVVAEIVLASAASRRFPTHVDTNEAERAQYSPSPTQCFSTLQLTATSPSTETAATGRIPEAHAHCSPMQKIPRQRNKKVSAFCTNVEDRCDQPTTHQSSTPTTYSTEKYMAPMTCTEKCTHDSDDDANANDDDDDAHELLDSENDDVDDDSSEGEK